MNISDFLKEGENVPRGTIEKLKIYHSLILNWQSHINLIGECSSEILWERHFFDSIQLLPFLPINSTLIDLGSGAGFPGMVLAICGIKNINLIENNQKKCVFLKEVARKTETLVSIHNEKIEEFQGVEADVITARALATINLLLAYGLPLLKQNGFFLLLKGKSWEQEIQDAQKYWSFDFKNFKSITHGDGHILKITQVHSLEREI